MRKIGVLTSGGDAPGMNAAIRAVVRSGISRGFEVYGIRDGYRGLVEKKISKLERRDVSDIMIRGGTILGSARLVEFKQPEVVDQAVANLLEFGIDALVVIGGDGTYKGAQALSEKGISCMALPGTIDNDIFSTDYTIGFNTAVETIVENVDRLRDTSSSHNRCSVVEVMGNKCGDLAIFSGLVCGAEMIITNETGYDEKDLLEKLTYFSEVRKKNHAIVMVSEKLTDVSKYSKQTSIKTQFSGRDTVLGHIQRGGSPSPDDRLLATRLGDQAVENIQNGLRGHSIGIINNQIVSLTLEEALALPPRSRQSYFSLHDRLV